MSQGLSSSHVPGGMEEWGELWWRSEEVGQDTAGGSARGQGSLELGYDLC